MKTNTQAYSRFVIFVYRSDCTGCINKLARIRNTPTIYTSCGFGKNLFNFRHYVKSRRTKNKHIIFYVCITVNQCSGLRYFCYGSGFGPQSLEQQIVKIRHYYLILDVHVHKWKYIQYLKIS